jgi:hypothetical protein
MPSGGTEQAFRLPVDAEIIIEANCPSAFFMWLSSP